MDTKFYPLLAGILVLVVAGFLFWQRSFSLKPSLSEGLNELSSQGNAINQPEENNSMKQNIEAEQNSQLKAEILKEGSGEGAKDGDLVFVHYTGYLTNGQVFDSSIGRGEPFPFTLGAGQVIKGWDQGVLGMKIGEKRRLTIPSQLAYGEAGAKDANGVTVIPPNTIIIFEVELLKINDALKTEAQ